MSAKLISHCEGQNNLTVGFVLRPLFGASNAILWLPVSLETWRSLIFENGLKICLGFRYPQKFT